MIHFYQTVRAVWFRIKLQLAEIHQIGARACHVGYNQVGVYSLVFVTCGLADGQMKQRACRMLL